MFVRAKSAPASGGGFTWDDTDQIVEVPDEVGHELVHVAGGAVFAEVLPDDLPKKSAATKRGKAVEE